MFKHPGTRLMKLSILLLILGILVSAALAVLVALHAEAFSLKDASGAVIFALTRTTGVIAGIVIFVLGSLCAYIFSLIIYAFGQLVHHTRENNYLLSRIAEHTKRPDAMPASRSVHRPAETAQPADDGPLFHPTHHGE